VAWPLAWLVKDAPPAYRAAAPGSAAPTTPLGEVLRTPAFYLLLVGSMCSIGAVGGTMQNLKLYLSLDHTYGQGEIARILSLVLAGSIIGRLLMGWLADRWARKHVMLLIYVIVAASIPLLLFAESWTMLHVFALLFGIGLGGDYMIIPLMAADLFGVQRLGRVMGFVLTADGIAEAVSPMLVAGLRDRMGTYRPGFLLLMGLAAVGAGAVALLPQKKQAI
jgi:MFS family permease